MMHPPPAWPRFCLRDFVHVCVCVPTLAQTDISKDRLRRLFARLDTHRFIVRHEVLQLP